MKAQKILKRIELQRQEGEKAQILRELNALLLTSTRPTSRTYIKRAIKYIEEN